MTDWLGVPELTDDAAHISSSFLSELPLSQAFFSQAKRKLPSSSPIFISEKENEPDHHQSNNLKYSQRIPNFTAPLARKKTASSQSREFNPMNNVPNFETKKPRELNPMYNVPNFETQKPRYLPPYETPISPPHQSTNFAMLGKLSPLSQRYGTQHHSSQLQSSINRDQHDIEQPTKRQCFQFSQVPKSTSRNEDRFALSQHLDNHDIVDSTISKGQADSQNDDDFVFTPRLSKTPQRKFKTPLPEPSTSRRLNFSTLQTNTRQLKTPDSGFFDYKSPGDSLKTPASLYVKNAGTGKDMRLRSVEEIPIKFRNIFEFPYFNLVQSQVLDDVLYSDKPLVVSAPTGAGKTAIFELSIVRLLTMYPDDIRRWKIVYVAPIKALCSERYHDWQKKFEPHGLSCMELTGDTEMDSLGDLHRTNLILTTPEKWDSMSRRWKDNRSLFQTIALFLVDEIHTLNDSNRGSTVEAVISRMKTLRLARKNNDDMAMRFIGVSATIPNIEDIATWLGNSNEAAVSFSLGEKYRPVKLQKMIVGYPFKEGSSDFRFDMNLAYRIKGIIDAYSDNKPTLVFCSSRKSVEQTADILKKEHHGRSLLKSHNREAVISGSHMIREAKIADMVRGGIGVHHAGLGAADRKQVEELFKKGLLPVLVSTSTLAMGVNLPAHLVVIKSTVFYNMGSPTEYSDSQVLQMIGRAGRPQFDTSATAVIMTKSTTKAKYESLVNGTQKIESSLHKQLIEHLNAEVVLHTITDIGLAVDWIRHTFLYVRVMKNPSHYGYPPGLNKKQMEKHLEDLCLKNLNELEALKLVNMDPETYSITPTDTGKLMARYCITFNTMKRFHTIGAQEGTKEMLEMIVACQEFDEIMQLRNNEKTTLNTLNKNKNKETIRYPFNGRIKTKQMKTSCLMQAQFSCLPIQDFSLSQDVLKIFRVGQRVAKCLMEFLWQKSDFQSLLAGVQMYKSVKTKLWVDSKYVARQLDGIGPTMSQALVSSGMTTFQNLEKTNPRELELMVNRHPPFGNQIRDAIAVLPKYEMSIEQVKGYKTNTSELVISIRLANRDVIENKKGSTDHQSLLIIGDKDNNVAFKWRIIDSLILKEHEWKRKVDVTRASEGPELSVNLISLDYVGLDISITYEPVYQWAHGQQQYTNFPQHQGQNPQSNSVPLKPEEVKRNIKTPTRQPPSTRLGPGRQVVDCQHRCNDKQTCGHRCCKEGIDSARLRAPRDGQRTPRTERRGIGAQILSLKNKMLSRTPAMGLQQFAYQRPAALKHGQSLSGCPTANQGQSSTNQMERSFNPHQSALRNLPQMRYGVGGRRLSSGQNYENPDGENLGHRQNQGWGTKENNFNRLMNMYENDSFEDNFDNSYHQQNHPRQMQTAQTRNMTNTGSDSFVSCPNFDLSNSFDLDSTDGTQQHLHEDVYANDRQFVSDAVDIVNDDSSFEYDNIQEIASAEQSARASPHHYSQDQWAELTLYQQDREAYASDQEEPCTDLHPYVTDEDGVLHSVDENKLPPEYTTSPNTSDYFSDVHSLPYTVKTNQRRSNPGCQNSRSENMAYLEDRLPTLRTHKRMKERYHQPPDVESYKQPSEVDYYRERTAKPQPRQFLEGKSKVCKDMNNQNPPKSNNNFETHWNGRHPNMDFIKDSMSDDDLCYAEEELNMAEIPCDNNTLEYCDDSDQSMNHKNMGKLSGKGSTVNNRTPEIQQNGCDTLKHRYGQVLAWVADSDSSPLSQKSNPKSKTPVFSKFPQNCRQQSRTPSQESESDSFGDRLQNMQKTQDCENIDKAIKAKSGNQSSFFQAFRHTEEDIADVSGSIFAGVF